MDTSARYNPMRLSFGGFHGGRDVTLFKLWPLLLLILVVVPLLRWVARPARDEAEVRARVKASESAVRWGAVICGMGTFLSAFGHDPFELVGSIVAMIGMSWMFWIFARAL